MRLSDNRLAREQGNMPSLRRPTRKEVNMKTLTPLIGMAVLHVSSALADCHKVNRIDPYGRSRVIQLCDNTFDLPSIELDPSPSVATPTVQPGQIPTPPPVGTTT